MLNFNQDNFIEDRRTNLKFHNRFSSKRKKNRKDYHPHKKYIYIHIIILIEIPVNYLNDSATPG